MASGGTIDSWWLFARHYIIPTFFVVTLPFYAILMALYPLENGLGRFRLELLLGNRFTWAATAALVAWAVAFLKIPSKVFEGPATPHGYVPAYSANGFFYYCCSVAAFVFLNVLRPDLSPTIYKNTPELLGNLGLVALLLCSYLWYEGKRHPMTAEKPEVLPFVFEFYRGMELHPRIFDVDVKQLTNCRVGLMLWQLLVLAFWFTSVGQSGFNGGTFANAALQSIYLAKFYWWETGYFTTLDIIMDRAGFYICWGCLAFVPSVYTYTTYYFVSHPPAAGGATSALFFLLGLACIYANYQIDHEKELFRKTDGNCAIWGRKPEYIQAKYQTADGRLKSSRLLVSGSWGVARHFNYVFELLLALFWNLSGWSLGVVPFFYNIFLTILLVHRIYRDEDKCQRKYGHYWKKYCEAVPYRLIPYIY